MTFAGYKFLRLDRDRFGGAVSIFYKVNIACKCIITSSQGFLEQVWVETDLSVVTLVYHLCFGFCLIKGLKK